MGCAGTVVAGRRAGAAVGGPTQASLGDSRIRRNCGRAVGACLCRSARAPEAVEPLGGKAEFTVLPTQPVPGLSRQNRSPSHSGSPVRVV